MLVMMTMMILVGGDGGDDRGCNPDRHETGPKGGSVANIEPIWA